MTKGTDSSPDTLQYDVAHGGYGRPFIIHGIIHGQRGKEREAAHITDSTYFITAAASTA